MDNDNDFFLLEENTDNDNKGSKDNFNDLDLDKGFMDIDNSYEKDIDQYKIKDKIMVEGVILGNISVVADL